MRQQNTPSFDGILSRQLREQGRALLALLLLTLLWAVSAPLAARLLQGVVDTAAGGTPFPLALLGGSLVCKTVSYLGESIVYHRQNTLAQQLACRLRTRLFGLLQAMPWRQLRQQQQGTVTQCFQTVAEFAAGLVRIWVLAAHFLFSVGFGLYFLAGIHADFLWIVLAPLPVWAVLTWLCSQGKKRGIHRQKLAREEEYGILLNLCGNLEAISTADQLPQEQRRYDAQRKKYFQSEKTLLRCSTVQDLLDVLMTRSPLLWMFFILLQNGDGAAGLIAVWMLSDCIYRPFLQLQQTVVQALQVRVIQKRLAAVFTLQQDPGRRLPAADAAPLLRAQKLCFGWPGRQPVLQQLDLEICAGECVAITGPSGVGKSTLLQLLLGTLQPTAGSLQLGGVCAQALDKDAWLSHVAYMQQHPTMFSVSVRDNLLFGRTDVSDAQLRHACRQASVLSEIEALPQGFDTLMEEGGRNFSGGQVQRLELARCLLRDADICFFDEPTSALDSGNEELIYQAIRRLKGKKTVLLITHRPLLLGLADRVIPLGASCPPKQA